LPGKNRNKQRRRGVRGDPPLERKETGRDNHRGEKGPFYQPRSAVEGKKKEGDTLHCDHGKRERSGEKCPKITYPNLADGKRDEKGVRLALMLKGTSEPGDN